MPQIFLLGKVFLLHVTMQAKPQPLVKSAAEQDQSHGHRFVDRDSDDQGDQDVLEHPSLPLPRDSQGHGKASIPPLRRVVLHHAVMRMTAGRLSTAPSCGKRCYADSPAHDSAHNSAHDSAHDSAHSPAHNSAHNLARSSAHNLAHNLAHSSARNWAHSSAHSSANSPAHNSAHSRGDCSADGPPDSPAHGPPDGPPDDPADRPGDGPLPLLVT
jgi:hypothetical protein